ncbi:hypothetical protein AC244_33690 [Ensifer adhaerens]|uniref:Uncharacterized protein n=1 Tax=Ensifer adhaerens TaxID=106592 RepID=A0A0L8BD90_ENSAD|nr:hypothetical protein AC244_33690 [Ensifer adhaerens]
METNQSAKRFVVAFALPQTACSPLFASNGSRKAFSLGLMARTQVSTCSQPADSVAVLSARRVLSDRSFGVQADQGQLATRLHFQTP